MCLSYLNEECQYGQAVGGLHCLSQIQIHPLVHDVHLDRDTVRVGGDTSEGAQEKRTLPWLDNEEFQ